jgi:8-oxo-dGTP pyrophosphatase MutT (NUDIX family)
MPSASSASLARRVRAHLAGELIPAPTRDAATVLLLREPRAGRGVEVCLLRRSARLTFAAGMYAFPGGVVDTADTTDELAWAGPGPSAWAERLGCEPSRARGYLSAAVRETFEESGVLLAGPADQRLPIDDSTGAAWEADRLAVLERSRTLAQVLAARGLALRSDLLAAWAHWVTPEVEERRYDTWFFIARAARAQRVRNASTEADRMRWISPAAALARHERGDWAMMLPTRSVLAEIADFPSVAAVFAAAPRRVLPRVQPVAVLDGEAVRFRVPGDPAVPGPAVAPGAPA